MPFDANQMQFPVFYPNPELLEEMRQNRGIEPPSKIRQVMGDLVFPVPSPERPYLYGCMVLSFDGKMGFADNPEGHLISKENTFDPVGAQTDFWGWNVCRTYADAVILGANTLWARIDRPWSAQIVDEELVAARGELGKKSAQPLSMIATLDGEDVPLKHAILSMTPAPTLLTSKEGARFLEKNLERSSVTVDTPFDPFSDEERIKIVVAGEDRPDTAGLMRILRKSGIGYVSVEAPGYIWNLIAEKMLDEYLLNYSGVMVGGTNSIGARAPFTSTEHPHVALLSVGYHSGFLYTRQKLIYE